MSRVLVTGGCGFIGRHVVQQLLDDGYDVTVFDNFDPQVHNGGRFFPPGAQPMIGDMRDPDRVRMALSGADSVVHLAAAVGVGQSMYEPTQYVLSNVVGTTVLLEAMVEFGAGSFERLVVASSMSVYGEGGDKPVREDREVDPRSVYALTKYDQERLCLMMGDAYEIPTTALRFFNVYGPGQALSNPYTGVMAIFASQLLNGLRPIVYEDGMQTRDFVHVDDVARAVVQAVDLSGAEGEVVNVSTGDATAVGELAILLALAMEVDLLPKITGETRAGDIRHCVGDRHKAGLLLGWKPQIKLVDGVKRQAVWLAGQETETNVAKAHAELASRGLVG